MISTLFGYPSFHDIAVVHDSQVAEQLIEAVEEADYLIADKGYDAETIRIFIKNK